MFLVCVSWKRHHKSNERGGRRPSLYCVSSVRDGIESRWHGDAASTRNPSCAIEAFCPISLSHVFDAHACTSAWRMNELAIANVDTYMAEGSAHGIEKNQIARTKFFTPDDRGGSGLLFCPSRQHQTNGSFVHGAHKTAAIESDRCIASPALVGNAQKTHGGHDQIRGRVGHRISHLRSPQNKALVQ